MFQLNSINQVQLGTNVKAVLNPVPQQQGYFKVKLLFNVKNGQIVPYGTPGSESAAEHNSGRFHYSMLTEMGIDASHLQTIEAPASFEDAQDLPKVWLSGKFYFTLKNRETPAGDTVVGIDQFTVEGGSLLYPGCPGGEVSTRLNISAAAVVVDF